MHGGKMEFSLYNLAVDKLTQSVTALNRFYLSLYTQIQHKADRSILANADELTGNRLARNHIESFLDENRQYLANSYQGLAIVQTSQQQSSRIHDKLEEMESLAEKAAGGLYSAEEVEAFQEEFETLMSEIDQIAIGTHPGGFFMLSSTAFGAVGVEVDRDQKVEIDSMDMTVTGLGLIDNMDLTSDPDKALTAVQLAIDEVSAHGQHLEETKGTLESALDILNDEREALLPALASVRENQSAWRAVDALVGMMESTQTLVLAVQARVESDQAIRLLLDEIE